jgi:hypothetical protein
MITLIIVLILLAIVASTVKSYRFSKNLKSFQKRSALRLEKAKALRKRVEQSNKFLDEIIAKAEPTKFQPVAPEQISYTQDAWFAWYKRYEQKNNPPLLAQLGDIKVNSPGYPISAGQISMAGTLVSHLWKKKPNIVSIMAITDPSFLYKNNCKMIEVKQAYDREETGEPLIQKEYFPNITRVKYSRGQNTPSYFFGTVDLPSPAEQF